MNGLSRCRIQYQLTISYNKLPINQQRLHADGRLVGLVVGSDFPDGLRSSWIFMDVDQNTSGPGATFGMPQGTASVIF